MTEDTALRPDTSDMLAVHRVFRNAFGSAEHLVGSAEGDSERTDLIAAYYSNVLAFLDVHHAGEDELLWPLLYERLPAADVEVVRAVAAQHEGVHLVLDPAVGTVASWRAAPGTTSGATVVEALAAVQGPLIAHLDREEAEVLPLVADVVTPAEWGRMPEHGVAHFTGDRLWLVLGLLREQMTQEQRDLMLRMMPPPAVEFWNAQGETLFVDFMAQVRR